MYPSALAARLLRVLACAALLAAGALPAATFTVTSAADTAGSSCGSSCTLRQAITAANASAAADTINFAITLPPRGEILIQPASELPTITQPLTINGYSQSGTRANNDPSISNAIVRIRVDGQLAGSDSDGITLCAPNSQVRGLAITRFSGVGVHLPVGCASAGSVIAGNFIGLASSGVAAFGNQTPITLGSGPATVGGIALADHNVVAGNFFGIRIDTTAATTIAGNLIGSDKSGALDFGQSFGILVPSSATGGSHVIGLTGAPNRIRYNGDGIRHLSAAATLTMFANHIADNDNIGIDLDNNGVTPNDPNDADSGPNGLQNFPVITAAERVAGGLSLTGTLDIGATQGGNYRIALYANSSCDPSGFGEGERFLGSFTRALSNTAESFQTNPFVTSDPLPPGTFITATATNPGLATSEFSQCFPLDPVPLVVNSANDVADGICNAAHCSLRDAIIAANAASDPRPQSIHFNIATPATGEIMIQPTAALPTLTRTLSIDGYTQPGSSVNSDPLASNAQLRIRLDGLNAGLTSSGLAVCGDGSSVRGLSITRFRRNGIQTRQASEAACPATVEGLHVEGNFIGLATDGISAAGNLNDGVLVDGTGAVIGGAAAQRNVISANTGLGVDFSFSASGEVRGNLLGTDRSGVLDRGNAAGIAVIGLATATATVADNLIAFNGKGVRTLLAGQVVAIQQNRFRAQDALGIDLLNDGVTGNDADDADQGRQNFPLLARAERSADGLRVTGSLDVKVGVSNAPYRIDVYANEACNASGHGEGEIHVGFASVNLTQTSGEAFSFELTTDVDLVAFDRITTTATATEGSSEFSACVTATDLPPGIIVNTDSDPVTPATVGCDAIECTLREAIILANLQQGDDLIRFALPENLAPFDILPGTPLPVILEGLTIDGYTQFGAFPNASANAFDAVLKINLRAVNGLQNLLRVCTTGLVTIRGLAFTGASGPALASGINEGGNCNVAGILSVQGNQFGIAPSGARFGNFGGILADKTLGIIGGANPADRNLISNSTTYGVRIDSNSSSGSNVHGNVFGRDPDDSHDDPNARDIEVNGASDIAIGSTGDAARANRFYGSAQAVVVLGATSRRVDAIGNAFIRHTGTTAIDLAPGSAADGITPNDLNDADTGPNDLQNSPVLLGGSADNGTLTVIGSLDVPAGIVTPINSSLAFYESTTCNDQTGIGNGREGEVLLGRFIRAFSSNAENFSVEMPLTPPTGTSFITAVVVRDGNMSEFSNCLPTPRPDALHANGFE